MKTLVLVVLSACGARTELAGTKVGAGDASGDSPPACHDEIIATDAKGASALAVDGDDVFWGTEDGMVRARQSGVTTTLALGLETETVTSIAVDAKSVYYATIGAIRRVSRSGGTVTDVVTSAGLPFAITLRGADVYWVDYGAGIAAGSVRVNDVPIVAMLDTPGGLAVDGSHVFTTCALALVNEQGVMGPLLRANLDGSDLAPLLEGLHDPTGVTTFGGRVYYIEQTDALSTLHGGVRSVDASGGAPQTEIATDDFLPIDLAVDASGVYATAYSQPESHLFHGGSVIASTPGAYYEAVRTSATAIYWTIAWLASAAPPADGASLRKLCK